MTAYVLTLMYSARLFLDYTPFIFLFDIVSLVYLLSNLSILKIDYLDFVLAFPVVLGIAMSTKFNFDLMRGVIYGLVPILAINVGKIFAYKVPSTKFNNNIIKSAGYSSSILIIIFLYNYFAIGNDWQLGNEYFIYFLDVLVAGFGISLYGLLSGCDTKSTKRLILISSCFALALSRTMLVSAYVFCIFASRKIRIISFAFAVIAFILVYFNYSPDEFNFAFKIVNSIDELFNSERYEATPGAIGYRAYESRIALDAIINSGALNLVFGNGYSGSIVLENPIELSGGMYDEIPVLHNGILYALYKSGAIGLICYMLFIALVFITNKKNLQKTNIYYPIIFILIFQAWVVGGFVEGGNFLFLIILGYITNLKSICNSEE